MLGKLIKHEFKAISHVLITVHAALLIISLIGRILLSFIPESIIPDYITVIFIMLFVFLVFAVYIGTYFAVGARFYKNLFTDEGYLSLTLPVTPTQHLLGKLIVGSVWIAIDLLIVVLSFMILLMNKGSLQMVINEITSEFTIANLSSISTFLYVLLLLSISTLMAPLIMYVCIAIGQLLSTHKILGSVVTYFVLTAVNQVIVLIAMLLFSSVSIRTTNYAELNIAMNSASYFINFMNFTIILLIVESIIYFFVTQRILTKKINLS